MCFISCIHYQSYKIKITIYLSSNFEGLKNYVYYFLEKNCNFKRIKNQKFMSLCKNLNFIYIKKDGNYYFAQIFMPLSFNYFIKYQIIKYIGGWSRGYYFIHKFIFCFF